MPGTPNGRPTIDADNHCEEVSVTPLTNRPPGRCGDPSASTSFQGSRLQRRTFRPDGGTRSRPPRQSNDLPAPAEVRGGPH